MKKFYREKHSFLLQILHTWIRCFKKRQAVLHKICRMAFPRASRVIDRFHVQRLALDAVQEIRIKHRWDAINAETDARENAKLDGRKYPLTPYFFITQKSPAHVSQVFCGEYRIRTDDPLHAMQVL